MKIIIYKRMSSCPDSDKDVFVRFLVAFGIKAGKYFQILEKKLLYNFTFQQAQCDRHRMTFK